MLLRADSRIFVLSFVILAGQDSAARAQAIDDEVAVYDRPLTPAEIIEHFPSPPESNSSIATTGEIPVALGFLFELADHHRMNVQARYDDRRPFWNGLRLQLDSLGLEMDASKSIAP